MRPGIRRLFGSQLRRNVFSGVAANAMNTALMLVSYPVYLHYLGYEKLGVWIVLSTVLTFLQMSNLGMGPAVTKLVAEECGRGNVHGVRRYVKTALMTVLATGGLALTALLLLAKPIIGVFKLGPDHAALAASLLPFVGILTVYAFLVQILTATLSGLGRIDLVNYQESVGRAVSLVISVVGFISGFGIVSLLVASTASYLAMHFMSLICIRKIVRLHILTFEWDAKIFKKLAGFGSAVLGSSIINMLFSPFNKLMLSRYAGVAAIPVYEIAFNASMQVRNFIETAFRALVPEISRISSDLSIQARERIDQIYRRSMQLIFLFGMPVYLVLLGVSPFLFQLWLRDRFVSSLPGAFRIMLIGTFLSLLGVPAYYTLMALGKMKQCFLSHVIQGTVNAGLVGIFAVSGQSLSLESIAAVVALAMGLATGCVIWQKHRAVHKLGRMIAAGI